MQSVQKSAQQKMLMRDRDPSKQPMIGRDRLAALRNSSSHAGGTAHSSAASAGHSRSNSGKLRTDQLPASVSSQSPRREESA